ncbi:MAG: hypothetical protein QM784_22640 [Polyangiaceae bacterium]
MVLFVVVADDVHLIFGARAVEAADLRPEYVVDGELQGALAETVVARCVEVREGFLRELEGLMGRAWIAGAEDLVEDGFPARGRDDVAVDGDGRGEGGKGADEVALEPEDGAPRLVEANGALHIGAHVVLVLEQKRLLDDPRRPLPHPGYRRLDDALEHHAVRQIRLSELERRNRRHLAAIDESEVEGEVVGILNVLSVHCTVQHQARYRKPTGLVG